MDVLVSLYLDKRRAKENNIYPLKLRVTFQRKRMYYGIKAERILKDLPEKARKKFDQNKAETFSLSEEIFASLADAKTNSVSNQLHVVLENYEAKYQGIASELKPFTFDKFKEKYENKTKENTNDVFYHLQMMVNEKKAIEKINTATAFKSTLESLKKYSKRESLTFEAITSDFLKKYDVWMRTNKKSAATIGIYMRHLRVVFNYALSVGITGNYPFKTKNNNPNGYEIKSLQRRKLALGNNDLKALISYPTDQKQSFSFYVDSWKLMFMMQGINPKDLCNLKYKNIKNGYIEFTREKTKEKNEDPISIPLNDSIQTILDKWGNPDKKKDNWIWPIFKSDDHKEQFRAVKQFVKLTNKYIRRAASELKIESDVSCYVARHSFASRMLDVGAPLKVISNNLGHKSTTTTEIYLNNLDTEKIKDWHTQAIHFE